MRWRNESEDKVNERRKGKRERKFFALRWKTGEPFEFADSTSSEHSRVAVHRYRW